MKLFYSHQRQLSIVPRTSLPQLEPSVAVGNGFFPCSGNAFSENEFSSTSRNRETAIALWHQTPISAIDAIRVDRATVREGKIHRYWPREVVEQFLAADVVVRP
jgi:hypothetical protein